MQIAKKRFSHFVTSDFGIALAITIKIAKYKTKRTRNRREIIISELEKFCAAKTVEAMAKKVKIVNGIKRSFGSFRLFLTASE